MRQIASFIDKVLSDVSSESVKASVKSEVRDFCRTFPLYAEFDNPMADLKTTVEGAVKHLVGNVGSVLSKVGEDMKKASSKQ
jgi:hypothetical protein